MNLSVVIPAHNEEEGVRPTVERLHEVLRRAVIPFEILVVNDHSTDDTERVLTELSHELAGVWYINNPRPKGFGYAIQSGLDQFQGDAVCIVMADASDDPHDVVKYYETLQQGYECAFGSRFLRQSRVVAYPRFKLLLNRWANWFISLIFGLRFNDTTNAFKAYRREVIEGARPLVASHFNITVELPLKAITRGYSYGVVPINWYNRATGVSKLKIKEMGSRYLFIVLSIWLEQRLAPGDYQRPRPALAARAPSQPAYVVAGAGATAPGAVNPAAPRTAFPAPSAVAMVAEGHMPLPAAGDSGAIQLANSSPGAGPSDAAAPVTPAAPSARQMRAPLGASFEAQGRNPEQDRKRKVEAERHGAELPTSAGQPKPTRTRFVIVTLFVLALEVLAMYGRSLHYGFVADDWALLHAVAHGITNNFGYDGGYHYNPVASFLRLGMYQIFGLNVVPYHIALLFMFWLTGVLTMYAGWRLTGRFIIGALAAVLYVGFGTQYEAVVWTVVGFHQLPAMLLYLSGFNAYMVAHDRLLGPLHRALAYLGFIIALILAPFTYEPAITLIVACVLYRLFVLDRARIRHIRYLRSLVSDWIRDFALPAIFLIGYVGFKYWLGKQTGAPQAPGLYQPWSAHALGFALGLLQAFLPGVGFNQLAILLLLNQSTHGFYVVLTVELVAILLCFTFGKPTYRVLLAWTVINVLTLLFGLGEIQSRHLAQIVMPTAIFYACVFVDLTGSLLTRLATVKLSDALAGVARVACPMALAAIFVAVGMRYAFADVADWGAAVTRTNRLAGQIGANARAYPGDASLYIIDLPDMSISRNGERDYMFLNAPYWLIELQYPGRFSQVIAGSTQPVDGFTANYETFVTPQQETQWSEQSGTLVLQYDAYTDQVLPWIAPRLLHDDVDADLKDHWVTTDTQAPSGYTEQANLGYVFAMQLPNTQALYDCLMAPHDHFVSRSPNCEGRTTLGLEGWVYTVPQTGVPTVALFRCSVNGTQFVMAQATCGGGTVESVIGYVLAPNAIPTPTAVPPPAPNAATQPLIRYYNLSVEDHWVTVGSQPLAQGYKVEGTLGRVFATEQPGTHALYGCVMPSGDHFVSLASDCDGQQVLETIGWIYSISPTNVPTVAIYSCHTATDHFVSLQANCEGQASDGLLGYVLTQP